MLLPLGLLLPASVDLSGVWTGSPAGSPREIMLAQPTSGEGFELLCRTTDYETPMGVCGWQSAKCTVAGTAVKCDSPDLVGFFK